MASLVGSVFDEFSTLNADERQKAVNAIGDSTSFVGILGPSDPIIGTPDNDIFLVEDSGTSIQDKGGIDIVVSSASYTLPGAVEHLILTGDDPLDGRGNSKDNVLAGNDGDNHLDGSSGDDVVLGGLGNDTLEGSSGHDTLCGGDGDDSIIGSSGNDSLDGGAGNDVLIAGSGHDTLEGNEGNDTLKGGSGSDTVMDGGEGDDQLEGDSGSDSIEGGAGSDSILGGSGSDNLSGGADNDTISGGSGNDTIAGGSGEDVLTGDSGADIFFFGDDSGTTTITDFRIGVDVIEVDNPAVTQASDILATVTDDGAGNAVFEIGSKTVTLLGIDDDDVNTGFFSIP